jgi:hypothetical protein
MPCNYTYYTYRPGCGSSLSNRVPPPPKPKDIAYGGLLNVNELRPYSGADAVYTFPLDVATPLNNITFSGSGLVIEKSGDYDLSYFANFSTNHYDFITLQVRNAAGTNPTHTTAMLNVQAGEMRSAYRSTITHLSAGDILHLSAKGANGGQWYIPAYGAELRAVLLQAD